MPNITVGCKLPSGLVIKSGNKSVKLNGSNSSRIVGGFGLTQVDKDFFDAWKKEFAHYGPLKHGLIFEQNSVNAAEGEAREKANLKSGFEPRDPDKLVSGAEPYKAD